MCEVFGRRGIVGDLSLHAHTNTAHHVYHITHKLDHFRARATWLTRTLYSCNKLQRCLQATGGEF